MIVAIVGIDGSGKTTQAKMLVERLDRAGHSVLYVRPAYTLLNMLGRGRSVPISPRKARVSRLKPKPWKLLVMGLAGYLYALASYFLVRLCLGRNRVAVCDRYFYQFFFDIFGGLGERVARVFPKPDITFFLAGDLDTLYARMSSSFDTAVSKGYYEAVMALFNRLAEKYGFVRINASLSKEKINDIIFGHLVKELER